MRNKIGLFWNDLEQRLDSIILIEDEDDILMIQDKYKGICLGLSQAKETVRLYSVHMYNTV